MTVWQQALSHFFAQPFDRRFIGGGEDEGEGDREVIFEVQLYGWRKASMVRKQTLLRGQQQSKRWGRKLLGTEGL